LSTKQNIEKLYLEFVLSSAEETTSKYSGKSALAIRGPA
jgi:hypothetical protein